MLLLAGVAVLPATSQVEYWSGTFNGGTTVGGWAPDLWSGGSGNFEILIPPGSTVLQAYLLAASHEDVFDDYTLQLNGVPITIAPGDQAVAFPDPNYVGDARVCVVDVTALIDPGVTNYFIEAPLDMLFLYQDYMLFVAFENAAFPPVSSYIILNDQALAPTAITWAINGIQPFPAAGDICASIWIDYACDVEWDAQWVDVNNNYIGRLGGNDTNSGVCAGILGNYTYSNGVATALGPDDTADGEIWGADALFLLNGYVSAGDTEVLVESYDGPDFVGWDNAVWGMILTYGSSCEIPDYTVSEDQTICPGQSLQLQATGGSAYSWTPAATLDDPASDAPLASPDVTTTYEVEITFDNGCSVTGSVTVTVALDALGLETAVQDAICAGTGSITLTAVVGGEEPFVYFLNGVAEDAGPYDALTPGNYLLLIEDALGCTGSAELEVEQVLLPVVFTTAAEQPFCEVNGALSITGFTSGTAPFEITLNGVLQEGLVMEDLEAGPYTIGVTDAQGCTGEAEVELALEEISLTMAVEAQQPVCETPGAIEVTGVEGGVSPFTYTINGSESEDALFEDLAQGEFTLSVSDANGCSGEALVTLETVFPGNASFTASPFAGPYPLEVFFDNSSTYFQDFLWEFGNGDTSGVESPSYTYEQPGQYTVTLTATDPLNGCIDTASWVVFVQLPNSIFIPNAFTPDNDGINDVFSVVSEGIDPENYHVQIFDRWGSVVFESRDPAQAWTGNVLGGGHYVPTGVYPYRLRFNYLGSVSEQELMGHVTVIR